MEGAGRMERAGLGAFAKGAGGRLVGWGTGRVERSLSGEPGGGGVHKGVQVGRMGRVGG